MRWDCMPDVNENLPEHVHLAYDGAKSDNVNE